MISEGLLSLVEEQLDLTFFELWQIQEHRLDLDFVVYEGRVDFTNQGFTIFTKEYGKYLRNIELDQMYPTIIQPLDMGDPEVAEQARLCREFKENLSKDKK